MRSRFEILVLGTLFLFSSTLSAAPDLTRREKVEPKFAYEMNNKAAQQLELKVAGLKKGALVGVVKALLGQPDSERTLYTKQFFGGGKFVAKQITYVLKRVHLYDDNVNDHVINLYFDQNNKLTDAERLGYSITGTYEVLDGGQIREKIL